jgi:undecaprenyl-diphosphatase
VLQGLLQLDLWLIHALNGLAGNYFVDHTINIIAGNNFIKGTVLLAPYWFYWFGEEHSQASQLDLERNILIRGIVSGLVAIVIARLLASFFPMRLRPFADPAAHFSINLEQGANNLENWSAFPSDHAAFVFAISFSLFKISRAVSCFYLAYSAAVICIPRIYIGLHYPSDILVGALIGVLSSLTVQEMQLNCVDKVKGLAERKPKLFYPAAFIITSELAQMFDNIRSIGRGVIRLLSHLSG